MRIVFVAAAVFAMMLGGLAAYTASRTARIGDLHPPEGQFARIDGLRIHFLQSGAASGRPVLLLHDASANLMDLMLALGGPLSKNLRVIAVDRPGHGWSERRPGPDSALPSNQARYVIGLLDKLKIETAIVVGHGWSGALALTLALDYPDRVAGLVLLAPIAYPWPGGVNWYFTAATLSGVGPVFAATAWIPAAEIMLDSGIREVFDPQEPPENYAVDAGALLALRPTAFRASAFDISELHAFVSAQSGRYKDIKIPTVIIAGDADPIAPPRTEGGRLAREIEGAKLIALSGIGHMPHYAATDAVVSAIETLAADLNKPQTAPAKEKPAAEVPALDGDSTKPASPSKPARGAEPSNVE